MFLPFCNYSDLPLSTGAKKRDDDDQRRYPDVPPLEKREPEGDFHPPW
jgi:hypothetical protein